MARYLGPTCKLSRREGTDLFLKSGVRPLESKCRHESAPGQHGQRRRKASDFGTQLMGKQKLKGYYGNIGEKKFRAYYEEAVRRRGDTGENLIGLLERRLDAVVYRSRFVPTVFAARQFVNHGHVKVNGKTVKPAAKLVVGDRIETRVHQLERVVVVTKLISKRVGAAVAIECFDDHSPPPPERSLAPPVFERDRGAGRPTKRDRRRLDELRGRSDRTR